MKKRDFTEKQNYEIKSMLSNFSTFTAKNTRFFYKKNTFFPEPQFF